MCGEDSLPEPDLAVLPGNVLDYEARHPEGREARLVLEVAWISQRLDRRKAGAYASAGVPVYWLLPGLETELAVAELLPPAS